MAGKTRRRLAVEQIAELVAVEKKIKASTKELKAMVLARDSTLMNLPASDQWSRPGHSPTSATWPGSRIGTGSPPGPARRRWMHPPASRSGTGSLSARGTGG